METIIKRSHVFDIESGTDQIVHGVIEMKIESEVYVDPESGAHRVKIDMPLKLWTELNDEALLMESCRNNGVDNWDWWDDAIRDYEKMKERANEASEADA